MRKHFSAPFPVLARRPGKGASAQEMTVDMIHCLASVGFAVNHKAAALFSTALGSGKFLSFKKHLPHEGRIVSIQLHYVFDMLFRNNKKMHRRLGVYVIKSQKLIIFVQLAGRNFPINDFTK